MNETIEYYKRNSKELIEKYKDFDMKNFYKQIDNYLIPNKKILDIGCGSGRDLLYFKSKGLDVYGSDIVEEFINYNQNLFDENKIFKAELPNYKLNKKYKNFFDIITLIGVIMHIKKEYWKKSFQNIKKYLLDSGTLIISYSLINRKNDIRFFENMINNENYLLDVLNSLNFKLEKDFIIYDVRYIKWKTIILKKKEKNDII